MTTMKTEIVRIGNSRGVRIPKSFIEEAGLENEVELRLVDGGILVESAPVPRTGWAEAAKQMHDADKRDALDDLFTTDFDDEEWTWDSAAGSSVGSARRA